MQKSKWLPSPVRSNKNVQNSAKMIIGKILRYLGYLMKKISKLNYLATLPSPEDDIA